MNCIKINTLLSEFGSSIGVVDLTANADGYCSLLIDEERTLHLKYDDERDSIRLFMELGIIPEEFGEKVRLSILDANVLWRGTGGSVLGVDAESSMATIAYEENMIAMHLPRFEQMLDTFITTADIWDKKIHEKEIVNDAAKNNHKQFAGIRA